MTGEGRSGGGAYAREKGGLEEEHMPGRGGVWRRSVCPGEGAVSEEAVYVRERGISAEAVFCKALLTKTFQNRAMNVKKVLRNGRRKEGDGRESEETEFSVF